MTDPRLRVITGSDEDATGIVAVLDSFSINVRLPGPHPSWHHQVLTLTLVDLLGRLFPRIHVNSHPQATAHRALPPGHSLLVDRIDTAHSHGGLTRQPLTADPYTVHVGPGDGPADLYVDGHSWQSYTGTTPSRLPDIPTPSTSVGPIAAACRAAAQITEHALAPLRQTVRPPETSVYASALTYTVDQDPINDPLIRGNYVDALLVGAGSVGGAAAYTFAHTPELAGCLTPIDPQRLENPNSRRALLATTTAASTEEVKVDVVKVALGHHSQLAVKPFPGTISSYHATLPRELPLPLVLCAVDSAESRRAIQDCLPLDLINAACHPHEITISGHRTGRGPCVCCLHMSNILNHDQIKKRLIANSTGLDERTVIALLVDRAPLEIAQLRQIERHQDLALGALDRYAGHPIDHLWNGALLYGAIPITTATAVTAVAAPFVTALAGTLLAGEALKAGTPALASYRLGPQGPAIKYTENPYATPLHRQLDNPERWPTSECLCQSSRRLRILNQRYRIAS